MKKLVLSFSLVLTLVAGSAFANADPTISEDVKESFKKEFAGAELVKWEEAGDHVKAIFVLNGFRTEAYFKQNGELQGSARSLFFSQLPLVVMTSVDKRFAGADIIDVNEVNNSSGTYYRITLESGKKKYRVRLNADGTLADTERLKN